MCQTSDRISQHCRFLTCMVLAWKSSIVLESNSAKSVFSTALLSIDIMHLMFKQKKTKIHYLCKQTHHTLRVIHRNVIKSQKLDQLHRMYTNSIIRLFRGRVSFNRCVAKSVTTGTRCSRVLMLLSGLCIGHRRETTKTAKPIKLPFGV